MRLSRIKPGNAFSILGPHPPVRLPEDLIFLATTARPVA